ncbi:MAG: cbb3-type cytochrome c oxidase subunit II [Planctomycetes bacterium]|nr:cbb3-type cytochrome c oxidase subunit II [Planctomycetota bacterium]
MFESRAGVLFVGGLGFFAFAFLSNGLVPMLMYKHLPEQQASELTNANVMYQFEDLQRRYPEAFERAYGKPPTVPAGATTEEKAEVKNEWLEKQAAQALLLGREVYVGEGCWHCHSQFVRPVSNESRRFGPVSKAEEYQNELQRPVLFGTRRVGPDLSREGGRRSNDWHAVHFFKPTTVSTGSPMPEYPWLFDGDASRPNERGLALMTYVQWLGSWLESYPYYEAYQPVALEEKK